MMNERIRELRATLGLTQDEFGSKIRVKRNTIASYETGKANPIDAVVFSICNVYNVNEEWLRHGTGEMFEFVPAEEIEALALRYKLPDLAKRIVKAFVELEESEMQATLSFIGKIVNEREDDSSKAKTLEQLNKTKNTVRMFRAAKSEDNAQGGTVDISMSDYQKLRNAPEVGEI